MSLVVAALVLGGGSLVLGLAQRYVRAKRGAKPETAGPLPAPPKSEREPSVLARWGFELEVGDVVEIGGQELWFEEGWLLREGDEPVVALFRAHEAAVVALPPPNGTLYVLDEVELVLPSDPPSSVESKGVRFERVRRLPVRVTALGKSAPLPWEEALLVEYRGLGRDALWVLGRGGRARAWQGRSVHPSEIVRWGGGERTL
ncbi:MAG: hypothetical protein U0263_17660 [Polyangiaceae bacterium]